MAFVHLHVHSQYSILDGQASIENLFARAEELGFPGLALTDHGNMFGVKEFFKYAKEHPNIKPIIGCEVYVTRGYDHKIKDEAHRRYYHLILLAKNYNGYKNLMKIVSVGHIEGMYYGKPRVSHEVLERYHEDLICSSACMAGEIPQNILAGNMEGAEKAILWHKNLFGEDYYLEVMLHKTEVPGLSLDVYNYEKEYCKVIFELGAKLGVKVIATNDSHFVRKEDGPAHDRLICLNTGKFLDEEKRLHYTQQEYLKSEEEMRALFPDHPEAFDNTLEILDKVERFQIDRPHVLPQFDLPKDFLDNIDSYFVQYHDIIEAGKSDEKGNYRGDDFCKSVAYLCYLTYEGAKERYGTVNEEQRERLNFELKTVSKMGFPDYFLIVQDFINWAKRNGISVGPGRGSAAGSAVAYCLKITNLDPIRYDLLFERFLNPERISMPDIDVDFDDEGRYRVIQYVQDHYGMDHISHVVTFGTMAAKLAIKDVARISRLPLDESNKLTKMIPDRPISVTVEKSVELKEDEVPEEGVKIIEREGKRFKLVKEEKSLKPTLKNSIKYVPELKNEYENGSSLTKDVLKYALELEGSIRQTGIHACAMIIGRGNLTDYIPITMGADKATGKDVWVSQYEGTYIEDVGMLKMDFLGLRTLSIIKECLSLIKKNYGTDIDIEKIDINDKDTYELYSRGDTKSVFQFESPGMMDWLQRLHPERFEDLIAMNALYRPGPMDYIPQFVRRKRGEESISYDLPEMKEYLEETYGVTVYQEQVMRISQKVANFSKGKADKLRKAMGKKQISVLESLYSDFIKGGTENGHPKEILDKIWGDWRKFAEYAFNKSHSTCYAWVSYQTGWLKAHYPSEFQAANLSQNLSNMSEIKEIMDDCKKHRIRVLNPDVNESDAHFTTNKKGDIRFGLGGIKGFGANIVDAIISEREKNGIFADIYDFMERMSANVNKKAFESLLFAGAFDSFGFKRGNYHKPCKNGELFIDEIIRYSDLYKRDVLNTSVSLFGSVEELKPQRPEIPPMFEEEDEMKLLQQEKDLVGMYLSAHPLNKYDFELETFTSCSLSTLDSEITECERAKTSKKIYLAGIVTDYKSMVTKTGRPWSKTIIEDKSGSYELALFGKDHELYMTYLQAVHNTIFIEGEIAEKYYSKQDDKKAGSPYTLKVKNIMLLGNVTDSFLTGFTLNLTSSMVTLDFRKNLVNLMKRHKGKTPLTIFLYDPNTHYKIEFLSRKFQVAVTSDLILDLKEMGIDYKANIK